MKRFMRYLIQAAVLLSFISVGQALQAAAYDDLLRAAELGDTTGVARLLDKGMDPDTADAKGNTILMIAARNGNRDLVWSLVRRKASASKRNQFGDTALMMACLRGDREIARMLIEFGGAEVKHSGWAPIHYAAFEDRPEIIRYLIAKGADKDAVAPNGYTALMLTARGGHLEAARALLYEDVDVQVRGPSGETALRIAREKKNTELAEMIKRAGGVE